MAVSKQPQFYLAQSGSLESPSGPATRYKVTSPVSNGYYNTAVRNLSPARATALARSGYKLEPVGKNVDTTPEITIPAIAPATRVYKPYMRRGVYARTDVRPGTHRTTEGPTLYKSAMNFRGGQSTNKVTFHESPAQVGTMISQLERLNWIHDRNPYRESVKAAVKRYKQLYRARDFQSIINGVTFYINKIEQWARAQSGGGGGNTPNRRSPGTVGSLVITGIPADLTGKANRAITEWKQLRTTLQTNLGLLKGNGYDSIVTELTGYHGALSTAITYLERALGGNSKKEVENWISGGNKYFVRANFFLSKPEVMAAIASVGGGGNGGGGGGGGGGGTTTTGGGWWQAIQDFFSGIGTRLEGLYPSLAGYGTIAAVAILIIIFMVIRR